MCDDRRIFIPFAHLLNNLAGVSAWAAYIRRWQVLGRVLFAIIAVYAANDSLLHHLVSASRDDVTIGAPPAASRFALLKAAAFEDDERHALQSGGAALVADHILWPESRRPIGGGAAEISGRSLHKPSAWARGPPGDRESRD